MLEGVKEAEDLILVAITIITVTKTAALVLILMSMAFWQMTILSMSGMIATKKMTVHDSTGTISAHVTDI